MSRSRILITIIVCLIVGFAGGYLAHRPAPVPLPAFPPGSTSAARGQELVLLAACDDCHTPRDSFGKLKMDLRLSGHPADSSLPPSMSGVITEVNNAWRGPWGLSVARNLTPSTAHGIGGWTLAQFIHTMRTGTDPSGRALQPPMPVESYAQVSDADLTAIYHFLQTIPANENPVSGP